MPSGGESLSKIKSEISEILNTILVNEDRIKNDRSNTKSKQCI